MPPWSIVVFWLLVGVSGISLARLARQPGTHRGWFAVFATVLALASAGHLAGRADLVLVALGVWFVLVWTPSVLALVARSLAQREWYSPAVVFSRAAAILHPCDGWRETPRYLAAFGRARSGDIDGALERLEPLARSHSPQAEKARVQMWRLAQCWEEIVGWARSNPDRVAGDAEVFAVVLRALGETGDTGAMVDLFERRRAAAGGNAHVMLRDMQRLPLFAFSGRPDAVRRVLERTFGGIPAQVRDFWMATARLAAGEREAARAEFERLLVDARGPWPRVLRRRLEAIDGPRDPLDERRAGVVDAEAAACAAETRYGGRGAFFSAAARGTHLLVALNLVAFVLEMAWGGSTDVDTLRRLGGLATERVVAGEWWRLLAATFLHFGPLHLAMNLMALAVLGPPVERQMGHARFLAVYLAAGVGAFVVCTIRALLDGSPSFVVGASGSVMGLVGASAGVMLRGWLRERAPLARNRGAAMAGYVLAQMAIDSMVPVFSFTTHLAGAVIGFVATLLLGDRLAAGTGGDPAAGARSTRRTTPTDGVFDPRGR